MTESNVAGGLEDLGGLPEADGERSAKRRFPPGEGGVGRRVSTAWALRGEGVGVIDDLGFHNINILHGTPLKLVLDTPFA